ncbi:MAG: VanZ family protein [Lachnospiraceae bacterium]|nr:VanZ family protein [Lachnospiraceae bacterium]
MLKRLRVIAFIPMIIMMITIWMFSSNNGETSSNQSLGIVGRVIHVVERITGHSFDAEGREVWEERLHTPVRKLAHMMEYLVFSLTVAFPFVLYRRSKRWISIFTMLFCVAYAATDEIHQLFVPNRAGRFVDVLIDGIGIIGGVLIFRKVYGRFHSSEN